MLRVVIRDKAGAGGWRMVCRVKAAWCLGVRWAKVRFHEIHTHVLTRARFSVVEQERMFGDLRAKLRQNYARPNLG